MWSRDENKMYCACCDCCCRLWRNDCDMVFMVAKNVEMEEEVEEVTGVVVVTTVVVVCG